MSVQVTRSGKMNENMLRVTRGIPPALTAAGMVVVTRIHRVFVIFKPRGWATGHTVRSVTISPVYFDGGWWRVKIGPTTAYSWFVEFGRKPGKAPPPDAMLFWVKEKKIAGSYGVKIGKRGPRYKRLGSKAQRSSEDQQAAFLIGRKIAEEGTKPFPAVRVGFRQAKPVARTVFIRVLARSMISG